MPLKLFKKYNHLYIIMMIYKQDEGLRSIFYDKMRQKVRDRDWVRISVCLSLLGLILGLLAELYIFYFF